MKHWFLFPVSLPLKKERIVLKCDDFPDNKTKQNNQKIKQ